MKLVIFLVENIWNIFLLLIFSYTVNKCNSIAIWNSRFQKNEPSVQARPLCCASSLRTFGKMAHCLKQQVIRTYIFLYLYWRRKIQHPLNIIEYNRILEIIIIYVLHTLYQLNCSIYATTLRNSWNPSVNINYKIMLQLSTVKWMESL